MNDPRLNQLPSTVAQTGASRGARTGSASSTWWATFTSGSTSPRGDVPRRLLPRHALQRRRLRLPHDGARGGVSRLLDRLPLLRQRGEVSRGGRPRKGPVPPPRPSVAKELGPVDAAIAPAAVPLLAELVTVADELLLVVERAGDAPGLGARIPSCATPSSQSILCGCAPLSPFSKKQAFGPRQDEAGTSALPSHSSIVAPSTEQAKVPRARRGRRAPRGRCRSGRCGRRSPGIPAARGSVARDRTVRPCRSGRWSGRSRRHSRAEGCAGTDRPALRGCRRTRRRHAPNRRTVRILVRPCRRRRSTSGSDSASLRASDAPAPRTTSRPAASARPASRPAASARPESRLAASARPPSSPAPARQESPRKRGHYRGWSTRSGRRPDTRLPRWAGRDNQ